MTPKERISKMLESKKPDRIGNDSLFRDQALRSWHSQEDPPDSGFNSDFKLFKLNDPCLEEKFMANHDKDKFLALSFSGPFERVSEKSGKLNFLKEIARNPETAARLLKLESKIITDSITTFIKKGLCFDGAWIWSDLAYKDNMFFSIQFYERYLFGIHKELISYLNSHNMPVIFHSDGKIDSLVPYLLEAGIAALCPLDRFSGMDIPGLMEQYKSELAFFEG